MEKAKRKCFNEVHVVSDAKEVIRALKGDDDRSIRSIISDIKGLASLFSFIDFFFLYLEVSMVKLISLSNSTILLVRILYGRGQPLS